MSQKAFFFRKIADTFAHVGFAATSLNQFFFSEPKRDVHGKTHACCRVMRQFILLNATAHGDAFLTMTAVRNREAKDPLLNLRMGREEKVKQCIFHKMLQSKLSWQLPDFVFVSALAKIGKTRNQPKPYRETDCEVP